MSVKITLHQKRFLSYKNLRKYLGCYIVCSGYSDNHESIQLVGSWSCPGVSEAANPLLFATYLDYPFSETLTK